MTSVALPQSEPPPSYFASFRPVPPPVLRSSPRSVPHPAPLPLVPPDTALDSPSAYASTESTSASESGSQLVSGGDDGDEGHSPAGSWRAPPHAFWGSSDPPRALSSLRTRPSSASSAAQLSASTTPLSSSQRSSDRHFRRGSFRRLTTLDNSDTSEHWPFRSSTGNLSRRLSAGSTSALDRMPPHDDADDPSLSTDAPVPGAPNGFTSGDADTEAEWGLPAAPAASARSKRRDEDAKRKEEDKEALLFLFLLYPLRLLAIVPEVLAARTLLRKSITLALAQQDLRRVGMRREPGPLELFMAIIWITTAGFHALSFTTLLLRRWLLYYAIFPSLVRLVLLQALCWTLVRFTIWSFGPNQDLPAWIVISVTTAFSDIVTRWVTSNIADMPPPSSRSSAAASSQGVGLWDRNGRKWEEGYALVIKLVMGDPTHLVEGSDESDGLEFEWPDSSSPAPPAVRKQQARQQQLFSALTRELFQAETVLHNLQHSAADDWEEEENPTLRARGLRARAQAEAELAATIAAIQAAIRKTTSSSSLGMGPRKRSYSTSSGMPGASTGAVVPGPGPGLGQKKRTSISSSRRKTSPGPPQRPSPQASPRPGQTRRLKRRLMGRRKFHWHVALLRNGLPIALLSFATLWILLIDGM